MIGKQYRYTAMSLITEEAKVIISDFSLGTMRVLYIYLAFMQYQYKVNQYNILNVKLLESLLRKVK